MTSIRHRSFTNGILLYAIGTALCLGACGGEETKSPSSGDSTSKVDTGVTPARPAPTHLADAPPEIASDTIPLRAPDGGPARYGIPSGRIVLRYSGGMNGERRIVFDHYGMRERLEDDSDPAGGKSGPTQHFVLVTTRDFTGKVDKKAVRGFRRPNSADDKYLASDSSKLFSLGAMIALHAPGKWLPPDSFHGYQTHSREVREPGFTHTIWSWRGITVREHFVAPADGMEFWVEAVEITPNLEFPDSTFELPKGYPIQEFPEQKPGEPLDPLRQQRPGGAMPGGGMPNGGIPGAGGGMPGGAPGMPPGMPGRP